MHRVFGKKEENESYLDRRGAYLIPIRDDMVAVVRTPKGYFLLGGGMDDGETDVQCIRRECMEETGCAVGVGERVCSAEKYGKHPTLGWFHPIQTYYLGELLRRERIPEEDDHRLEWVTYEEIRGRMFSDMQGWAITQCFQRKLEKERENR
ncbi:MAG: NUDIX domain-containing protein [Clostridia bacterium]|nr:NUDIX domain-containing protein [Clostridia bacterium]